MVSLFSSELLGAVYQLCSFTLIPFIWWWITARKKENFFQWIGLKRIVHEKNMVKTLLITILVSICYFALMMLGTKIVEDGLTTAGSQFTSMGIIAVPAALVYGFIRTGLSEEILFRGFLLKRIQNKFGFQTGNLIQAVLFGLMHGIPFGLITQNVFIMILLTILPGAFGWYQGWLNEKRCGGSIIPSWLLHGSMNFIVAYISL